jgi:hypothetical protein
MKLVRLTLTLPKAFAAPAGISVWHVRATPYTPRSATQNGAAAVEAEASYGLPQALTLVAKKQAGSRVRVSGRLTLGGKGVAARAVDILAGGRKVATAKTSGSGTYATTVAVAPAAKLSARAVVPARYLPSCTQPAFAPLPCTWSILAGFAARSAAAPAI